MSADTGCYSDKLLPPVEDVYLVVLRFRFAPLNFVQEAPNVMTFLPPHLDSVLLFADIIKKYVDRDWRYDFVKAALFQEFDKWLPDSLNSLQQLDVPLATVLLPVVKEGGEGLEMLVSTSPPYLLKVSLKTSSRNPEAILAGVYKYEGFSRQESLWLRKRDDIAKLGIINGERVKLLLEGGSNIESSKGGYRAIDVSLKVPIEYLSTEAAFLASAKSEDALEDELAVLRKMGVGKKRDMGFGDLVGWKVYQVRFAGNIKIVGPMALAIEEAELTRVITLRNTPPSFIASLRDRYEVLPLSVRTVLSQARPPYWVRRESFIAPFSEFLLKPRRGSPAQR